MGLTHVSHEITVCVYVFLCACFCKRVFDGSKLNNLLSKKYKIFTAIFAALNESHPPPHPHDTILPLYVTHSKHPSSSKPPLLSSSCTFNECSITIPTISATIYYFYLPSTPLFIISAPILHLHTTQPPPSHHPSSTFTPPSSPTFSLTNHLFFSPLTIHTPPSTSLPPLEPLTINTVK